jgi:hypothetical protein
VYVHQGVLFGVKFDPKRLEVHGAAVPLLDDLAAIQSPAAGVRFLPLPSRLRPRGDPQAPTAWMPRPRQPAFRIFILGTPEGWQVSVYDLQKREWVEKDGHIRTA